MYRHKLLNRIIIRLNELHEKDEANEDGWLQPFPWMNDFCKALLTLTKEEIAAVAVLSNYEPSTINDIFWQEFFNAGIEWPFENLDEFMHLIHHDPNQLTFNF